MTACSRLSDRVYVVWPPVWNAFDPHVAVPALCGYLADQGVPVRQFDLNVAFFRDLVDERTIEAQAVGSLSPSPAKVQAAIEFARLYYRVVREPLRPGYQQRFSDDAEQQLLGHALTIFNQCHPDTIVTTLGVYHAGDPEDSDFVADFAAHDQNNPFAAVYRKVLLPEVARELPAVVGISVCGSFQLTAAFTLARLIKEVEPRIRVVIGGAFFSTLPDVLFNDKTRTNLFRHVDAVVLNEGEQPFLRLIREVVAGLPPQPAPNVVLPADCELKYDPRCCLPAREIATPVFPADSVESYFGPRPRLPVETSRGCYWGKCTFCNLATGSNERYRAIPVENISRALATLAERHGANTFLFSSLALAPKVLRELSTSLRSTGAEFGWSAWIRPERSLTKQDFERCREAGCSSLAVTPESFCDATLSRMEKGARRDNLIRLMGDLIDAGLCGGINLIPGFPGETSDDFLSTLEVCRALGLRGEFFPFCLLKNSPVYKDPRRFGVIVRERAEKDLAVSVPFEFVGDASAPSGLELIQMAAQCYPHNVFADDSLAGYTFDFACSRAPIPGCDREVRLARSS